MLKDFLNIFTGAAASAPAVNGIRGIPAGASFGKVFDNILSSFSPVNLNGQGNGQSFGAPLGFSQQGLPNAGFGQQFGTPPSSAQSFRNLQGQFGYAQAGNSIRNQALAPGAVTINSPSGLLQPPQPSRSPNQLALSPLQGFAGQLGNPQFNQQQGIPSYFNNQPPAFQQGQGGFGKLSVLLSPIIGIISVIRALFNFRGFMKTVQAPTLDRSDLGYNSYQSYLDEAYKEGNFDEPSEYEGSGFAESESQSLSDGISF